MTYFRDEGHFDSQPWTIYFHLGVAFMGQPVLQLEKYSCCKRQRILDHYGDMRHLMACQILSLWAHLGPIKLHFIPGNDLYFLRDLSYFDGKSVINYHSVLFITNELSECYL